MNERNRLGLLVLFFAVAGVGLWIVLFRGPSSDDVAPPVAVPLLSDDSDRVEIDEAEPKVEDAPKSAIEVRTAEGEYAPAVEGSVIMGRVYDEETFEGIEGVKLRVRSTQPQAREESNMTTDSDGNYSFAGLSEGAYEVHRFSIEEYLNDRTAGSNSVDLIVAVGFEGIARGADFALKRGLAFSGIVVDVDGERIGGVSLSAESDGRGGRGRVESGEDGTFRLASLPPGNVYELTARKEGFAPFKGEFNTHSVEDLTNNEVLLKPEARVEGVVVDARGKALAEYRVRARSEVEPRLNSGYATTDENGAFSVGQLAEGEYRVSVRENRMDSYLAYPTELVRVKEGRTVSGLRLIYDENAGAFIEGYVTDSRGEALEGANVKIQLPNLERSAETDATGYYRLGALEEGSGTATVYRAGYTSQRRKDVSVSSSGVDFVLLARAAIEGQVFSALTGQPITEFGVDEREGISRTYSFSDFRFKNVSDPEGRFSFDKLDQGDVTIAVRAPGHSPNQVRISGLAEGEVRRDVRIVLDAGTILHGTVRDVVGEPIPSASITVQREGERRAEEVFTGVDGAYSFDSLYPGQVTIAAYHKSYGGKAIPLELRPRENRLDIALDSSATIRGRVRLGSEPARGFDVGLNYDDSYGSRKNFRTKTDEMGHYELTMLPSGSAQIMTHRTKPDSPTNLYRWERLTIPEKGTLTVDLDLRPLDASIEGYLYGGAGAPVSGRVQVRSENGREHYGGDDQPTDDGYYRIESLAAGRYMLYAHSRGYPTRNLVVHLNPKESARRDIWLEGGGSARVNVSNLPPGTGHTRVRVFHGAIDIPAPSPNYLQGFQIERVAERELQGNSLNFPGLEPGSYTLHIQAFLEQDLLGDRSEHDAMTTLTEFFTIEAEGEEVSLDVSF